MKTVINWLATLVIMLATVDLSWPRFFIIIFCCFVLECTSTVVIYTNTLTKTDKVTNEDS